jgi:hypothetical protein
VDSSIPRYVAMSWIVHHSGSDAGWVMGWRVPPDLARKGQLLVAMDSIELDALC